MHKNRPSKEDETASFEGRFILLYPFFRANCYSIFILQRALSRFQKNIPLGDLPAIRHLKGSNAVVVDHDAQRWTNPTRLFMRIFAVGSGLVHRQDKSDIAGFHLP